MLFLIEKRGFYYRPNASGYTGLKSDAGRYSFEEAAERVGPNGPEGPQDGMCMWQEDEAPDYSSRCPWDVKAKDQAYKQGYADALKALADKDAEIAKRNEAIRQIMEITKDADAEIERLRAALEWYGEQALLARLIHSEGDAGRHALAADGGDRARAALAETEKEGG